MMRTSEDSADEIEPVESTNGADPGKVMTMHITTPLSQPAQRRTPRPLDFVSISASQPEVYMLVFGVLLSAKPDSLFRGLLLAQAPHVHNVNDVPPTPSKYPSKHEVCYPSLAYSHVFHT